MPFILSLFSAVALGSILLLSLWLNPRPPNGLSFPPGPRGKPILGLLGEDFYSLSLLKKWKDEYGDLVSFHVLGNRFLIIYSKTIAHDLFEKRSKIYSDRHPQPMVRHQGWGFNLGFMQYGDWWRRHRRGFHQFFNFRVVNNYEPVQLKATKDLIHRLYESPDEYTSHLEYFAATIIMKIVYDYDLKRGGDSFLDIVKVAVEGVAESITIGSFLVDFLPFLEYLPEWFPGGGWKRKAKYWRESTLAVNSFPFDMVKKEFDRGTVSSSTTATALTRLQSKSSTLPAEEVEIIKNVSGVAYAAGTTTTLSSVLTLVLAMVQHPEAQKKAQEELDNVVKDRLPTLEDRPNLPYTDAFCEESQRWRPALPLGVFHMTSKDDIYNGYFIPKGSIVIGNSREILRDESLFGPNAEDFDPERFFRPGVEFPSEQWGFGRRVCPGRHLARNSLFLVTATILKLFDIMPAKDENGNDIPISGEYEPTGITAPKPFKCSFKPRSEFALRYLQRKTDNA